METVVWIVIAVVVLLVLVGLALALTRRRRTVRRHQAEELRQAAVVEKPVLRDTGRSAQEAELEAQRARMEAERAESRATEAEREHLQVQAHHEDRLREADRLDPEVDHRAVDYEPAEPRTTDESGTDARVAEDPTHEPPSTETGGSHRA